MTGNEPSQAFFAEINTDCPGAIETFGFEREPYPGTAFRTFQMKV
jgi:hypothetical protein